MAQISQHAHVTQHAHLAAHTHTHTHCDTHDAVLIYQSTHVAVRTCDAVAVHTRNPTPASSGATHVLMQHACVFMPRMRSSTRVLIQVHMVSACFSREHSCRGTNSHTVALARVTRHHGWDPPPRGWDGRRLLPPLSLLSSLLAHSLSSHTPM